jgi:hypothetical protein
MTNPLIIAIEVARSAWMSAFQFIHLSRISERDDDVYEATHTITRGFESLLRAVKQHKN